MDSNYTCMELALEGERLCKGGDYRGGVAFLEAALQANTSDLHTLSAIYSQLGNASFYLGDYVKATEYHKKDLNLARSLNDKLGEAKASGNLGNTLKVIGKFDEAIICCQRHLDISKELNDKVGEGRALYNLGNVYHAKGKHIGRLGHQEPGEFPEEVKSCLQQAVDYYIANLQLVVDLGDRSAQGRAYGNLGNTHYLLGNFPLAITYHKERLKIAKEFGDKSAERRAHSNLGNAYVFLGQFETAAENYTQTLVLAQQLGDRAVEAQACYSLGNTYALLRNYPLAIDYHMRHLRIAQELQDKIGEARAFWSLGNAHSAIGDHEHALNFAKKHLEIAREIGDQTGQATAQMSLADLKQILGFHDNCNNSLDSSVSSSGKCDSKKTLKNSSMENLGFVKSPVTVCDTEGNCKTWKEYSDQIAKEPGHLRPSPTMSRISSNSKESYDLSDKEMFFDFLSRFQSKRMDDQRCSLSALENKENQLIRNNVPRSKSNTYDIASGNDEFFDMIAGFQSKRLDEQRASLPCLPQLNNIQHSNHVPFPSNETNSVPDEGFLDMLMRCQGTRIEDQRSSFPVHQQAPTVPDEDFFGLIMRVQSGRIDDQRSELLNQMPIRVNSKANGKAGGSSSGKSKAFYNPGNWTRTKR